MTWEFQGRCTFDFFSAFSEPEAPGARWQEAEHRHQQTQRRNSFFIPEQSMLGLLRVNHLTSPLSSSRDIRFYLSMSQNRIWCKWAAASLPWRWFDLTKLVCFSCSPHFYLPILHLSTLFSNYVNDFVTTWGCFHTAGEHNTPQSRAWFMLQCQHFGVFSCSQQHAALTIVTIYTQLLLWLCDREKRISDGRTSVWWFD